MIRLRGGKAAVFMLAASLVLGNMPTYVFAEAGGGEQEVSLAEELIPEEALEDTEDKDELFESGEKEVDTEDDIDFEEESAPKEEGDTKDESEEEPETEKADKEEPKPEEESEETEQEEQQSEQFEDSEPDEDLKEDAEEEAEEDIEKEPEEGTEKEPEEDPEEENKTEEEPKPEIEEAEPVEINQLSLLGLEEEPAPITEVAEEDSVAKIGDTYYASFEDAVEAAETGDTIYLTASIDRSYKQFVIDKGITIDGQKNTLLSSFKITYVKEDDTAPAFTITNCKLGERGADNIAKNTTIAVADNSVNSVNFQYNYWNSYTPKVESVDNSNIYPFYLDTDMNESSLLKEDPVQLFETLIEKLDKIIAESESFRDWNITSLNKLNYDAPKALNDGNIQNDVEENADAINDAIKEFRGKIPEDYFNLVVVSVISPRGHWDLAMEFIFGNGSSGSMEKLAERFIETQGGDEGDKGEGEQGGETDKEEGDDGKGDGETEEGEDSGKGDEDKNDGESDEDGSQPVSPQRPHSSSGGSVSGVGVYRADSGKDGRYRAGVDGNWVLKDAESNTWNFVKTDGTLLKSCLAQITNPYAGNSNEYSRYAFDDQGTMRTGWFLDGSGWYLFHTKSDGSLGKMLTGFIYDEEGKRFYYLDPSTGAMRTGWQLAEGAWRYFNPVSFGETYTADSLTGSWRFNGSSLRPYGSMYQNEETPDGYTVDENGVRQ